MLPLQVLKSSILIWHLDAKEHIAGISSSPSLSQMISTVEQTAVCPGVGCVCVCVPGGDVLGKTVLFRVLPV